MVRLIKLKHAVNINLTTLDVTYNPNNITDKKKAKKKHSYFKEKHQIQTKLEMQRREFWECQFTFFPCKFYRNLPLTI